MMNYDTATALRNTIATAAAEVRGTTTGAFFDGVRELRWYRLEGTIAAAQAVLRTEGKVWSKAEVMAWAGVTDRQALLESVYSRKEVTA